MKINIVLHIFLIALLSFNLSAQDAKISIDVDSLRAKVSPDLHGIFFEEISHGGEGGLYAELIQNRGFEECRIPQGCHIDSGFLIPPRTPHYSLQPQVGDWKMPWGLTSEWPSWSLQTEGASKAKISLTTERPLNDATPHSLQLDITDYNANDRISIVNDGFWGIRVDKGEMYNLRFFARTDGYSSPVNVSLESDNGAILASAIVKNLNNNGWNEYKFVLKATESNPKAKFHLSFNGKGKIWIDFVSLFPAKTYKNRTNGMRKDLAELLAGLKPAFIRWPGGCFVEGITVQSAPEWKRTIGPVEKRPGTYSPWGYWSSDGFGYHEFLQFCEDIGSSALYVFNCGVSCDFRSGTFVPDDSIEPYIASALDAIAYTIGPVTSKWGAERVKNGHPNPFPLKYVEVGNEQVGKRYGERFNYFYKAIKSKYPQIEIIASMGISHKNQPTLDAIKKMDIADEHTYKSIYWPMMYHDWYDKYERKDWSMYIGEYACNGGVGKGNMMAALNDATSILMYERNSDLIKMTSYAPLLENVNSPQWDVNLIKFNSAQSYGRISYYAIKMMNENKATVNLKTSINRSQNTTVQPLYTGKIGLSTWDTYADFKDIQVIEDGKVVYTSDFKNRTNEWVTTGGKWIKTDSAILQTQEGAWPIAILKDKSFDTYTLKLKARKTGGYNAFMIPIAIKDSNNFMRAHIGAWWNKVSAFEVVSGGIEAMVTQPVYFDNPIENNRWYDVEIRVGTITIECYLDGKLLMSYSDPNRFFGISGKDETTGEIVIKMVNAYDRPYNVNLQLNGLTTLEPTGKIITLSAPTAESENTFDIAHRFIPEEQVLNGIKPLMDITLKPLSVTILRVKPNGFK